MKMKPVGTIIKDRRRIVAAFALKPVANAVNKQDVKPTNLYPPVLMPPQTEGYLKPPKHDLL
jgi:hypothetical protein